MMSVYSRPECSMITRRPGPKSSRERIRGVGEASSLEVSTSQLTSPWNTTFYRMVGPDWPVDSPPLTVNPG